MYRVTQLAQGLTVATASMPHMASVSLGAWIGIGSRYEPPQLNGVCHFIEHLVFKGTPSRSARQISQEVEGIGGYLNAFTSEEATCFHAKACHDRFGVLLDVLMDMLLHSKFDPGDIQKEREVIKEEIAMYLDQPQLQVQEILNGALWPNQPLGRPITGTNRSLDRMGRRQLLKFLRQNYLAGNTLIVAAGHVDHRHVVRTVKKYARHWKPGAAPTFVAATDGQKEEAVVMVTKETEQTQLALGVRTCSRHDPRRYAVRLLNAILGENMSSRLFQVVREEHGLAYSIYSTPTFFADTGDLVITAGLETDKLEKSLRLIMRELEKLIARAPAAGEMRRARDYLIGQIDINLENTDNQMNWVGEQWLAYGELISPSEVKARLSKTTAAEVRAAARDLFRTDRFNLALVTPLRSSKHLRKCLRL